MKHLIAHHDCPFCTTRIVACLTHDPLWWIEEQIDAHHRLHVEEMIAP